MWKKSTASAVDAWTRRNCRQLVSPRRAGAGGIRARFGDPADRRGSDPVTQRAQLALDALVPPRGVVPGQPLDQRGDLPRHRRPAGAVRVGPPIRDQTAVPTQDRTRADQPVVLHRLREQPDQRGPEPPGRPSPTAASGSRVAGRPPRVAARAARHPSTRWSGPAAPASRQAERRSDRAAAATQLTIIPQPRGGPNRSKARADFWHPTGSCGPPTAPPQPASWPWTPTDRSCMNGPRGRSRCDDRRPSRGAGARSRSGRTSYMTRWSQCPATSAGPPAQGRWVGPDCDVRPTSTLAIWSHTSP